MVAGMQDALESKMSGRSARFRPAGGGEDSGRIFRVLRLGSARVAGWFACALASIAVSGCALSGGGRVDPSAVSFPSPESAWMKDGIFVNLDNLRQMIPGMTKPQVYDLLGPPHFDEGVFGVRVWNYLFNFRTGNGNDFIRCQYQLRFDATMRTEAGYWNRRECAEMVYPRPVAAAP